MEAERLEVARTAKPATQLYPENLLRTLSALTTELPMPAASECAVQLHDRECFAFLRDDQVELHV
jgi:hypothetical protein